MLTIPRPSYSNAHVGQAIPSSDSVFCAFTGLSSPPECFL